MLGRVSVLGVVRMIDIIFGACRPKEWELKVGETSIYFYDPGIAFLDAYGLHCEPMLRQDPEYTY